ncbi:thiaminase II [Paracraurococcus lichenis]|uniref:Aminopyrimidine aminohydrolase n=1 Tax=Paracraurococcus lichenis TaxID=3064888 RepID=A0ABT9DW13_9PROT|nr:thiaminase II [Paracraurococcus sp. LOR1-02]MDO9708097.1 thiaminase II [Paracraurococcus sp. LOR1-02]
MDTWTEGFGQEGGLFRRLREACAADWRAYTWHPFVQGLSDGTLPLAAFRRYLIQDYLFLIHFARAEALAVFKAESVEAMREKAEAIRAILAETEMHLRYCASWGLTEADVRAAPESAETVSYTRYVIDRGLAGDILDLEVALAPCTVGYAEVAQRILADPRRRAEGNPYQSWIDTYADPGYQAMAKAAAARIDALGESHGGHARFAGLSATFAEAARLEARFWQQGLDAAEGDMVPHEKVQR